MTREGSRTATLSCPGSTGASSTPRPHGSITAASGILGCSPSRAMTPRVRLASCR